LKKYVEDGSYERSRRRNVAYGSRTAMVGSRCRGSLVFKF
jgi:hypothetical protein